LIPPDKSLAIILVLHGITAAAAKFSKCRPQTQFFSFLLLFLKNPGRMPK